VVGYLVIIYDKFTAEFAGEKLFLKSVNNEVTGRRLMVSRFVRLGTVLLNDEQERSSS